MSNAAEALLSELRGLGARLWVEGDKLKLRAPEGALSRDLTGAIQARKADILALLQPEPPASIPPLPPQDSYELSAAQRRLWVLSQIPAAAAAYNIPLHQELAGPLDRPALETAFARLVERHESLRTTFAVIGNEPRQIVHPRMAIQLAFRDLRGRPDPEATARQLGLEHAAAPFDLVSGPLLRAGLLRLGEQRHVLLFTIAHIVADGVSLAVLARDLARFYRAERTGEPDGLPRLAFGYPAFAAWQNRLLDGRAMASHRAYWHAKLAGELPVLALPIDHPRPQAQGYWGGELHFVLPPERLETLHEFCRRRNASLFMVLHAVVKVLLRAYTGQDDLIVGCAVAGRDSHGLADQIGCYLNVVALRSQVCGGALFETFFAEIVQQTSEAFDHQAYPFDRLVEELGVPRDASRSPVFGVMLVLQSQDEPGLGLDGICSRPAFEHPGTSKFDLTFNFKATSAGLILGIEYDAGLFEPESVQAMAESLIALAEAVTADPGCPVQELPLVTPGQRALLLERGRGPELGLPAVGLFQLIEAQARRAPNRRAVADSGRLDWTYAELMRAADDCAARLHQAGVGPGCRVGVLLERGAMLPAALLGVLRNGAAYVPLDPAFPAARLAIVAADAELSALLTQSWLRPLWPAGVPVCCVDDPAPAAPLPPPAGADPLACAYILYTSGSTGTPKGVRVPHRAVVNLLSGMTRELGMAADACLLAITTVSFDIAVLELFLPLTLGSRVYVCDRETAAAGPALARCLAVAGADWMQATPATWRMLLDSGWPGSSGLNALCGGEALPPDLATALLPRTAGLWNLYGPTETTVWSTCGRVEPGARIGLGRPIANTSLYVVDDRQRLVPPGAEGELHIGGAGVAMDYWRRPELTAGRFLPSLAADPHAGRVHRTGDRVRWAAGGRLHYLGRSDGQIKLRGHRIELGEVAAALAAHPGVDQATADIRPDPAGGERLVAWYTGGRELPGTELRAHLGAKVPHYMIPSAFLRMPQMPLTPNGKIDRQGLPDPALDHDTDTVYAPPRTEWELVVARLWQDVLGVPRVGLHDDFFELGGHSLRAAALAARLQSETGARIAFIDVFRNPTVHALASLIPEHSSAGAGADGIRPATAEELSMLDDP